MFLKAQVSEFILATFVQRCTDKSSTVRAKAMACLSKVVGRLVSAAVPDARRPQWLQAHTAILTGDRFLEFDFSAMPEIPRQGAGSDGDGGGGMDEDRDVGSPPPDDGCCSDCRCSSARSRVAHPAQKLDPCCLSSVDARPRILNRLKLQLRLCSPSFVYSGVWAKSPLAVPRRCRSLLMTPNQSA